jgi:NADPH:quinone reductase-like Zn-dependent oxidoreductase
MQASVITETGGLDAISVKQVPTPEIDTDGVLVKVRASAVNHTDIWIRRGYEGEPPIITGIDVAGEIADVGESVDKFDIGDRVVLYPNTTYCGTCEFCNRGEITMCHDYGGLGVKTDGGHAEYVAIGAKYAVAIPDDVPYEAAAAIPSNFGTAWRGLVTRGNVGPSDDVLVLGASGGVGHGAVQIAAHVGATVYAATSSDAKAEKLRKLGVDYIIDYTERDIDEAITDLTDRGGVDLVFESIGGEMYQQAVRSLVRGGRLVTIGATEGDADEGMLRHVFWKQLEIIGATGATIDEFKDMLKAFFTGDIQPVIDQIIGLEEIPWSHERLSDGAGFGKIIVQPYHNEADND